MRQQKERRTCGGGTGWTHKQLLCSSPAQNSLWHEWNTSMCMGSFTALQHLLVSRYVKKNPKHHTKNQECGNKFFHQAMPHVAWLSQSFPIPSSKQLRASDHVKDTLWEDSIPLFMVLMQNTIPRTEKAKEMWFLRPTTHLPWHQAVPSCLKPCYIKWLMDRRCGH